MTEKGKIAMKKKVSQLEYFGITKVEGISPIPEGMYLIERIHERRWLMELLQMNNEKFSHIGTLDLNDVICVANKSCLENVKKEEFYEALQKIFNIDFTNKLHATQDIATVFSRVASYTKKKSYK